MKPKSKWMQKLFDEELKTLYWAFEEEPLVWPLFMQTKHYVAGPYKDSLNAEWEEDNDGWANGDGPNFSSWQSADYGEATSYKGQALK